MANEVFQSCQTDLEKGFYHCACDFKSSGIELAMNFAGWTRLPATSVGKTLQLLLS